MDDAFALVAHPQLWVGLGAVLVLGTALLIELTAALRALPLDRQQPATTTASPADADGAPLGPEAYDWLYE